MTRPPASVRRAAVVAVAAVAAMACGTSRPPPGVTEGQDPTLAIGGPCAPEETTRSCHGTLAAHDGYVDCYVGTQTCRGGVWSACGDGVRTAAFTHFGGDGLSIASFGGPPGSSGPPCSNDPCDPYCMGWNETPTFSLSPPPSSVITTVDGSRACPGGGDPAGQACATNADCFQDWHCQAGTCAWNFTPSYVDASCVGVDLTLNATCTVGGADQMAVCNRGTVPVPVGQTVKVTIVNAPPSGNWGGACVGCVPCGSVVLAAPLVPGACISVPGCGTNGNKTGIVNYDLSIPECGAPGAGFANNEASAKDNGGGCPAACSGGAPATYTSAPYHATCPPGYEPEWNFFMYDTTIALAGVRFEAKVAPDVGGAPGPWIPAGAPFMVAQPPFGGDPPIRTAANPIALPAKLGAPANAKAPWLRLHVTVGALATVNSWQLTYNCLPTE